jgi:hypothetical protein
MKDLQKSWNKVFLNLFVGGRIRIRRNNFGSGSGRAGEAKKLLDPMDTDLEHWFVNIINVRVHIV